MLLVQIEDNSTGIATATFVQEHQSCQSAEDR